MDFAPNGADLLQLSFQKQTIKNFTKQEKEAMSSYLGTNL